VSGAKRLYEIYLRANPTYTGRVTVPVLWDKQTGEIVSNESSEIIRMFNSAFDKVGAAPGDYYPAELRGMIDELNRLIYDNVNNGVYKAGFATTQQAYEEAVRPLFATLDNLDARLATQRYLCGDRLKLTGGYSPRLCDSMPSTSGTSSATCAGSWIIPISGATRASFISIRVSKRR
jgi:putative glutathione S-transferase